KGHRGPTPAVVLQVRLCSIRPPRTRRANRLSAGVRCYQDRGPSGNRTPAVPTASEIAEHLAAPFASRGDGICVGIGNDSGLPATVGLGQPPAALSNPLRLRINLTNSVDGVAAFP